MTAPMPPALRATLMQLLADELADQYPGLDVTVIAPGETVPPGARLLPAVRPHGGEPLGDVGVPRPGRGRVDDDPQDS
jgi:hypothetical protein